MATASSAGGGQHHASLNLMACVRESSPQQDDLGSDTIDADLHRHDPCNKKRRFHPFRGLRRIFRKKARHQHSGTSTGSEMQDHETGPEHAMLESGTPVQALDAHRSRSTSTLLSGDESCPRRRSGNGLFPCHSGLSVSHDSVFTAEHRTPHSSSEDLDTAQSSSSLSIQQLVLPGVRAELLDALRRRRGRGDCTSEDDEDLGLPRSPCNSPTTADVLLEKGLKENPTKSHSTCSDGSLLSMDSSEMDEDSLGQNSGHSSKLSLHDKKTFHESDLEFDLGVSAAPLSHSAARHKMSVRPKRTHGAPRKRRIQQLAGGSPLPSTPELNEEASGRSASPDVRSSDQDFSGTDELSTTTTTTTTTTITTTATAATATSSSDQVTAWPSSDDGMKSPYPVTNLLPAETQLKSASLPPGLALTPEMSNAESPITPIITKVKRCNSSIAQRQSEIASAAMHQFQRSVSEQEYGHVRTTTMTGYQHHVRTVTATETDITKGPNRSNIALESQKRVFGVVGEEDEDNREDDINEDVLHKEKERDEKKKDDSSFFRRIIRRSGKKKKEAYQDIDTISNSSSTYSSKQVSEIPPVVPKRIDLKGRYANETVNDYAVNVPPSQQYSQTKHFSGKIGGTRSTPASRQRVMPINIPASPEGQRKVETNREMEEITVGLPLSTSPSPPGIDLELTSRKMQESLPANRMQVSYSTSPPKPTWPESSAVVYSNKQPDSSFYSTNKTHSCSEILPPWRDGLEPKLMDSTSWTHDQDHNITEVQHFRSKLRIAGLSSYQQRVTQMASDLRCEEREYTSLIDNFSSEDPSEVAAARQFAVKKSKSFRTDVEGPLLPHNIPAFSGDSETDSLHGPSKDHVVKGEQLWKYEDRTKTVNNYKGSETITSQQASSTNFIRDDFTVVNGSKDESDKMDTSSDFYGRHFTKNVFTSRNVSKETSNIVENSPVARICNARHPDRVMKKSASLDSIGSFGDSKKSPSPEPHLSSKKSSSSESISSFTQQSIIPVCSNGFSITSKTKTEEENKTLHNINTNESSVMPTSHSSTPLTNTDKFLEKGSPSDVPKSVPATSVAPVIFSVSSRTSLPESSKLIVDTSSKLSESSSRSPVGISNQPSDKTINKTLFEKSEQSNILTPSRVQNTRVRAAGPPSSTEQVPEFLKVQLNRVDSKPATNVVLSTSMVFDNTDRSYSPQKMSDDRQIRLKRKESIGRSVEKTTSEVSESAQNGLLNTDTPVSQTSASIKEKRLSREDLITGGNVIYDSNLSTETTTTQRKVEPSLTAASIQETNQRVSVTDSDSSTKTSDSETTPTTTLSQKQRSKSLPSTNPVNVTNRKYSIVSISSSTASSPPPMGSSKPVLKKQAISLDSAENNKPSMKKQTSQDFEDIAIVEKSVIPNLHEVSNNSTYSETVTSQKKSNAKNRTSWKEEETVIMERSSDSGPVEVIVRSKKIISTKDFGIKKEHDIMEKRTSGNVELVSLQEGKKFAVWKDEENSVEKKTPGGELVNSQENNCNSEVILRKKSLSRGDIVRGSGSGKDEEPELLKVFARRSLKLKDSESEALGQQVAAKLRTESTSEQQGTKSRDSDKENEGGDSPREERKKQVTKEPLAESKIHIDSSESSPILKASSTGISLSNNPRNGNIVTGTNKFQRSLSSGVTVNNENGSQNNDASLIYRKENPGNSPDKRQRNRTVPESPKTDSNLEKTPHRVWANIYKDKEIDITNSDSKKLNTEKISSQGETKIITGNNDDSNVPRFKRIQQRKEEWELRAQQALKKTLP